MKKLSDIFEGLLDSNFNGPDFNIEPINVATPLGKDSDIWRKVIASINKKLIPYSFYSQINGIIKTANDVVTGIERNNIAVTELGKMGSTLHTLAHYKQLEIDERILTEANDARLLNDWIDKANHNSTFRKLILGLGSYFYGSIGEREMGEYQTYGHLVWTVTSPNENAQKQLEALADKLSKINPAITVIFSMNPVRTGQLHALLTKHAK